jgi:hypothetical protein
MCFQVVGIVQIFENITETPNYIQNAFNYYLEKRLLELIFKN